MARWVCPRCDREFGRSRQSHVCVPGCTVDDTFAGRPAGQREAYDRVVAHLRSLGPLHEDAVSVGVFLKVTGTVAQARPRPRGMALLLWLPRPVEHPRLGRVIAATAGRVVQQVVLRGPQDVDDVVLGWLTEAYLSAED